MKKKLSILITSLAGGGAERVVSILLNHLRDKYDITLILMNDTISYDIPINIKVVYLENTPSNESSIIKILKLPLLALKYKKICKENNIAISLSFMYRPNFISIFAKMFGLESKVVISERNTPSKTYIGHSLASVVGRLLVKHLYPYADIIIPNSKGNASDLIENFNIKKEKIEVIENPFDFNEIDKLSNNSIHIDTANKFIFLMVGRLEKHKRHLAVVEVFSKLEDESSELWILGKGKLKNNLEELINELNLQDRVKLLGFDKNPYKYMKKVDCFILNSTREGFPNVLVEAMICGLPCISSDCYSGPREILAPDTDVLYKLTDSIEIAKYGILVPVDSGSDLCSAMKIMINDNEFCKKLSTKSLEGASSFLLENIIKKFEGVL